MTGNDNDSTPLERHLKLVDDALDENSKLSDQGRLALAIMLKEAYERKDEAVEKAKRSESEHDNTKKEMTTLQTAANARETELLLQIDDLIEELQVLREKDEALELREFAVRLYHILERVFQKLIPEFDWNDSSGIKDALNVCTEAMKLHQSVTEDDELLTVMQYSLDDAKKEVQGLEAEGFPKKRLKAFGPLLTAMFHENDELTLEQLGRIVDELERMRDKGHIAAHVNRPDPEKKLDEMEKRVLNSGIFGEGQIKDGVVEEISNYKTKYPHNSPTDLGRHQRGKTPKKKNPPSQQPPSSSKSRVSTESSVAGALSSSRGSRHDNPTKSTPTRSLAAELDTLTTPTNSAKGGETGRASSKKEKRSSCSSRRAVSSRPSSKGSAATKSSDRKRKNHARAHQASATLPVKVLFTQDGNTSQEYAIRTDTPNSNGRQSGHKRRGSSGKGGKSKRFKQT